MILPLLLASPSDSLPFQSNPLSANAIVKNSANGLNIPDSQSIAATATYTTSTWIFSRGYDYLSLLGLVTNWSGSGGVEVMVVPVSAVNPTQELDGIILGSLLHGQYSRVQGDIPNVFGFKLRFTPIGSGAWLSAILELQLAKK